jgi:hypothetical protein
MNLHSSHQDLLDDILAKKKIEADTEGALKAAVEAYLNSYIIK